MKDQFYCTACNRYRPLEEKMDLPPPRSLCASCNTRRTKPVKPVVGNGPLRVAGSTLSRQTVPHPRERIERGNK